MPLSGAGGRMQYWSPGNSVFHHDHASMQRTANGLFVVGWNGAHLLGSTSPPGLYIRPSKLKPGHSFEIGPPDAPVAGGAVPAGGSVFVGGGVVGMPIVGGVEPLAGGVDGWVPIVGLVTIPVGPVALEPAAPGCVGVVVVAVGGG